MTRLSDGDDSPVVCAGCGAVTTVASDWPWLPAGWTADSFGEFCPACSKGTPDAALLRGDTAHRPLPDAIKGSF